MARLLAISKLTPDLTPHSLRHTHTSLLAEAGVALEQIMGRPGHSDNQITTNVYLHVTKEMKKEASQKFSELLRSLRSVKILYVSKMLAFHFHLTYKQSHIKDLRALLHHAAHSTHIRHTHSCACWFWNICYNRFCC